MKKDEIDNRLIVLTPELIEEWDYNKNVSSPDNYTIGSGQKVWWKCKNGHNYLAAIFSRAKNKTGCPYCSGQKVLCGYNDLMTTNPKLAQEWDYEKNKILPNEISKGSTKKIWWLCEKNHSFEATVANRSNGTGCPYCSGKKVLLGYNDLYTWCKINNKEFLIDEFDSLKNNFSMTEITPNSGKKVWWLCPNGHSYCTYLTHRTQMDTGCGICSHKVFKRNENDLLTTHPELAKEWDYERNETTPDMVMAGSNKNKYWFICKKGHSYKSTLLNRLKGTNCPTCAKERHTSFPEKAIFFYLEKYINNVVENYHTNFLKTKEIDIFLPEYKLGIEYDGCAWHKNITRDLSKDKLCYENGVILIRIREIGCKEYESKAICKYIKKDDIVELENAIKFIFNVINDKFYLLIEPDINIQRDRMHIFEKMELYEKTKSILSVFPEIYKYWDNEKNGQIKPEQISYAGLKKFYLKCDKGHSWEKCARYLKTLECPYCKGYKVLKGYNDLFTTHPKLKKFWSKKNKISPSELSYGSQKYVLWKCNICKGEYTMKVYDKAKGHGCPYCNNRKLLLGYNDLTSKNSSIASEWDYKKNEGYIPENFTIYSKKSVWWKCSTCNYEWNTKILNRYVKGNGCPQCANKRRIEVRRNKK